MAIDFMIMPLSRYIAGDFVTPAMQFAWDLGLPYTIVGPDGVQNHPVGLPFGGSEAPARRLQIIDMLLSDLQQLPPPIPASLWDERSAVEPSFHRVDPASYGTLLEETAKPGGLLRVFRRPTPRHLDAMLFLPCSFDAPFEMTTPFERRTASAPRALQQLTETRCSEAAASAAETLRAALADAIELRLPLIVDV